MTMSDYLPLNSPSSVSVPAVSIPPVSIIVNTYNRGAWLEDALRGLAGLDYPDFEIIVVNGPSTDDSAEVIARRGTAIKALTCVQANLSVSRNVGIAAAAGEIIAFIDDDAVPHPQWLRRLVARYTDPVIGAVGGFTVDNTGTAWQMRKTLCDRFGNAHHVTDYFDERPLNRPGTPFYPSLLGTNSSFRASALRAIGGFDHAFAYLLDETDVCLRLVDAGWHVHFEPDALVWHQFAPSHIRSGNRVARTLYPSAVSRGYFIARHGGAADLTASGKALDAYRDELLATNARFERDGYIDAAHHHALNEDVMQGLREGQRQAMEAGGNPGGNLAEIATAPPPPFVRYAGDKGLEGGKGVAVSKGLAGSRGLRIALISQGWPPENDNGIARWTQQVAHGLVARGHTVHVLTKCASDVPEARDVPETIVFSDGIWLHRLHPDATLAPAAQERYGLPTGLGAWAMRVWREARFLKSFGVDLFSFPIWDLEGLPLLDDPDLTTVVSLHTTYAMARPFKPEWQERPLLAAQHVDPVIDAETALFDRAPWLLANSQAIIDEIATIYGRDVTARATIVPHGTPDPLVTRALAAAGRDADTLTGAPLRVLFVGRFEPRKGFDLAVRVAMGLIENTDVDVWFAGGVLDDDARATLASVGAEAIVDHPRVRFLGLVDRDALDDMYVAADIVLMPSRFESFGLVAIEAMAAGRPVLALDAAGLGEIARTEYGAWAFADGPDGADATVVGAILAEIERLDADRIELCNRGRMARAAWQDHFSIAAMITGLEAFYAKVAGYVDEPGYTDVMARVPSPKFERERALA
jgi:glycosyltransferase involved in cell wall biosynthesis